MAPAESTRRSFPRLKRVWPVFAILVFPIGAATSAPKLPGTVATRVLYPEGAGPAAGIMQGDTMPWQRSVSATLRGDELEQTAFPATPPDPSGPPRITMVRYLSGTIRAPAGQYVVAQCNGHYLIPVKVGDDPDQHVVYIVSTVFYARLRPEEKFSCAVRRAGISPPARPPFGEASFHFLATGYQIFVR